ncbi:4-hydroxythreonine-4-phosphate dehydrogenase PdxA [Sulfobacillus harzensis]|uniref:4-hydroxythreonine-4-phosphate dehydrogenase PdxA n=1 Tax=Sulfobacillus harzensis TaxID=2729629 RepID=A0A7Y0Q200_9FIRM|nr:4-hydroxythreonine-4-phosphate dehydrogenase PdxA [Sulfobacillus harzensis]NMP21376.1 4-hydroxythreonine-4-phosphate dehydrogenase PdxA [Sulfobacillus harzensis]
MEPTALAITMGDPAGIGPELAILGVSALRNEDHVALAVVGDQSRLKLAASILQKTGRIERLPDFAVVQTRHEIDAVGPNPNVIGVVDLANVPDGLPWGEVSASAGSASYAYVVEAVKLAQSGSVDAICTAPIHKKSWELAHVPFPGHTEALATLSGAGDYAMMLRNQRLRVVHCTTHIAFRDIIQRLTPDRIVRVARLAHQYLGTVGISAPRIALSALNPHAGDDGLFGDEEAQILRPALERLRDEGLPISGPWPADTVFARAQTGEFDVVIALYHDQGHIAIKMLGIDTGVNQTIGLPIIRTSVDHGTAFDIAGKGIAHETSMVYAMRAAIDDARLTARPRSQR